MFRSQENQSTNQLPKTKFIHKECTVVSVHHQEVPVKIWSGPKRAWDLRSHRKRSEKRETKKRRKLFNLNMRDEPRERQWSVSQAASQPAKHACREEINYHEISCNSCEWASRSQPHVVNSVVQLVGSMHKIWWSIASSDLEEIVANKQSSKFMCWIGLPAAPSWITQMEEKINVEYYQQLWCVIVHFVL